VVDFVAGRLIESLRAGVHVLWLISGGSCIPIAVEVAKRLQKYNVSNLTVTLTDERYGLLGHADSNWQQLLDAGFVLPGATLVPLLGGQGRQAIAEKLAATLREFLGTGPQDIAISSGRSMGSLPSAHDPSLPLQNAESRRSVPLTKLCYTLGLFGMGSDGHTAGLLPGSSALESQELAADFTGPDFERITMTPAAIAKLDEAVLYAVGKTKHAVLAQLKRDVQLNQQPAQVLKHVPRLTVFNDYQGGDL
jgi:6-phosphogluconolactonase/glucosamine-6-phosphate isomerase/deaminase